ncbi:type III secretion system gatekeeper subunit SctW [Pantoea sp. FN0307]|uniref:type III secretion system gatekeeper subunit SctW n=1 Tax=Pantoea sp. FN0307 TaxID=3418560 RepID=UPI003CE9C863
MLKTPTLPLMPHPFKALMKAADGGTEKNASRVPEQSAAVSANDMKEEVGLMFSERAESQKKTEQRRVQQQHLRHRQNAGKVELHKLYAMLDSDDRARRETHLGQLRDALKRKPPADTDELLAQLDNDPARCDLLLRVMEREARDQGDDELCHTINNHLQTLQTQHGERLRAGLNTAAAFAEFTVHPQQRQTLRNLYYDSIVHQQSAIAMVDLLLAHTEPQQFVSGLRTLQRALADDIAALASSISTGALRHIQTGLAEARQVSHTLEESQKLLERMAGKMTLHTVSAVDLTRRLLHLSHHGAWQQDLQQLGEDVVAHPSARQLSMFFNAILPLVRSLPLALWKVKDGRKTALALLARHSAALLKNERKQARNP